MSLSVHLNQLALAPAGHPARVLLGPLQLNIPAGCVHTLMGPSGSGKSSLLAAIAGTLHPALVCQGHIRLNGTAIDTWPTERRRIGLLFQDALLFPHLTVLENLLFAVPAGPRPARLQTAHQALTDMALAHLANADPASLSGGERARVALARALLAQPQALLLDEPFAQLDLPLRARMRQLLFDTVRQRHIPALLVTHDPADVADPAHLTQL
ncbi:MAG TPA: ATP-binding cassette domain-containing protein [Burkholderiaceae bacterium]|nr:ATP-binding cassette domain-containing protein [Burkholderiaceae bacterium]